MGASMQSVCALGTIVHGRQVVVITVAQELEEVSISMILLVTEKYRGTCCR